MPVKLSVIVLNYNVEHFLELCLHSVTKAIVGIEAELIVVDNNSPDGSVQMLKKYFPNAKLIANHKNLGFSKAYNLAVEKANGEYICVLNPDTVVNENTFVNCLKKADSLTGLGIMGTQLVDGRGFFLPESKRNLPTTWVSFFKVFGKRFSKIAPYYANHLEKNNEGEVEILVGAFMLVKKAIYKEAKGFDERYFMYGEDIDFSYSVQQLGYKNYYLGTEKVIHFKGESTIKDKVYRERFYGAMKLFYKKYFRYTWFTDLIISSGIQVSALLGSLKKEIAVSEIEQYQFFGNSEKIKNILATKFNGFQMKELDSTDSNISKLIFLDTRSTTYTSLFKTLKGAPKSYFRFILPYTNKCIGSDTSSGRGKVVTF